MEYINRKLHFLLLSPTAGTPMAHPKANGGDADGISCNYENLPYRLLSR